MQVRNLRSNKIIIETSDPKTDVHVRDEIYNVFCERCSTEKESGDHPCLQCGSKKYVIEIP